MEGKRAKQGQLEELTENGEGTIVQREKEEQGIHNIKDVWKRSQENIIF